MKIPSFYLLLLCFSLTVKAQLPGPEPVMGYETRIIEFIDSLPIFDTHEHLLDPEVIKKANFLDFGMLFLENGYNDLISSGMKDTMFRYILSPSLPSSEKWKILEPHWKKSFNTSNNRILLRSINDIYGINQLNSITAGTLSDKMKKSYSGVWFDKIIRGMCNIDYIIQDGPRIRQDKGYVKYAERLDPWIQVKTKLTIDSIALKQTDPIYTLEGFVKSMSNAFERAYNNGNLAVIKIDIAYDRSLLFEKTTIEAARKVFKTLVSGNEDMKLSMKDAKPLQDYMVFQLIGFAKDHNIPVAFHTGFQAGNGNYITNADPTLLSNIFLSFPDVKFVLFHGSYPYGGELSALAKNFRNVHIDMNWTYAISPAYAARYLDEWLETVPANKIMAFGGDQRMPEMTYGSLIIAKNVVSRVLVEKVKAKYFTEEEAKIIARMILHDNGINFYNLK
jgi:uncharacterized protein